MESSARRTYETASFVTARRVDGVGVASKSGVTPSPRRKGGAEGDAVELRERAREFRII